MRHSQYVMETRRTKHTACAIRLMLAQPSSDKITVTCPNEESAKALMEEAKRMALILHKPTPGNITCVTPEEAT